MDHKNDYSKFAYLVMDPSGSHIHQILQIKNNDDRLKKISEIQPKGLYLYYTTIYYDKNDKVLKIKPPYIVDFDSVPEAVNEKAQLPPGLICDICKKRFSSTSGLTNHKNVKHRELGTA